MPGGDRDDDARLAERDGTRAVGDGGGGEPVRLDDLSGQASEDAGEALDVSAAVRGPLLERAALVLAGLVIGVVLGRVTAPR